MKNFSIIIALLFLSCESIAQKTLLTELSDVAAQAKTELDASMKSGELKEFGVKNNMKGEYIFDITIHERGKVLSVFAVSNDSDNIKSQNLLKDFIRTIVFSFKMPKKKNYKFQYVFQFQ